jgi:DNA-binding NarL/FixJ family response regulator
MRLQLLITGDQQWALQGVAQALQRSGDDSGLETTCVPLDRLLAGRQTAPPSDVLVVVEATTEAAGRLIERLPAALPVLWLGADTRPSGSRLRGPTGWIAADADDARLAAAVHALAAGLSVTDDAVGSAHWVPAAAPGLPSDPLTPRELEVFELLAKGLANRDIALALGISSHTVKFHVAQILEKTGAATRTEAVRQGLRLGWIGL